MCVFFSLVLCAMTLQEVSTLTRKLEELRVQESQSQKLTEKIQVY